MNGRIILTMKLLGLMSVSWGTMADTLVNISIGYEHTSGNYGLEDDTEITTIPLVVQYIEDAWRFRLNIPYIRVTGDGSVVPGGNGVISNNNAMNTLMGSGFGGRSTQTTTTTVEETQSGPGDITTSVSYAFLPKNDSDMFYEITAEVKWGTASADKNLGTGENDYSLNLYSMYGKYDLKPFLSLGYLVIGDTDLVDYNDVFFATAGLMYQMNSKTSFSVIYDYQQATVDAADDGHLASLYVSRQFNQLWSANVYLLNGFSDSVANSGAGFTLIRSY